MRSCAPRSLPTAALFLAFTLLPAGAAATGARVLALGGQQDYLEDQSNVLAWYGSLVDYPDLVALEVGDWSRTTRERVAGQGAGLHLRLDREGRWGTAGVYLLGDGTPRPSGAGGDPEDWERDDRALLMWGRQFGPVTAALAWSGTSWSETSGAYYQEDFRHTLGAGLRWEAGRRLYGDVAAELLSTEFSYLDSRDTLSVDPVTTVAVDPGVTDDGFGARARVFWGVSEQVAVVPVYEHLEDDRAAYDVEMRDAGDLFARVNRWGIGLNLLPDPDRLLVLSVEYEDGETGFIGTGRSRALYDYSREQWTALRGRLGFEARVLSWLTARGAAIYLRSEEQVLRWRVTAEGSREFYDASFVVDAEVALNLGLALHLGRFEADFVFNDEALFNLGGLLTNTDAYDPQFTRVSLLYSF